MSSLPDTAIPVPTGGPAPAAVQSIADPRMAQLIGKDSHLPAVPPEARTPDALRQRFALPPQWAPEVVREKRFSDRQPTDAAVLVPIVMRPEPTVLLTERTAHLST
ncbi:coenzyme A pyrophosphatase, partial [Burkholderia sola]